MCDGVCIHHAAYPMCVCLHVNINLRLVVTFDRLIFRLIELYPPQINAVYYEDGIKGEIMN